MKRRNLLWSCVLAGALVCGGLALARQAPTANIDAKRNPNLAAAQQHIIKAYQSVEDAQKEHKDKFGGHATKANQLLEQADQELKLAAEYIDQHK